MCKVKTTLAELHQLKEVGVTAVLGPAEVIPLISAQFKEGLPKYTLDARLQGLASWAVAATGPAVVRTLPVFWQKSAARTIMGCRMLRVGAPLCKSRSPELDAFCTGYVEWLWECFGRKEVVMLGNGQNAFHKFDFHDAYDALWSWAVKEGLLK